MVTLTPVDVAAPPEPMPGPTRVQGGRDRVRWGRGIILILGGLYFLIPLLCAFWFSIDDRVEHRISFSAYTGMFSAEGVSAAFLMSLRLAVATIVITVVLMVPTMLVMHLRVPRSRPVIETLCLMPLVIPPVALVVGIGQVISASWAQSGPIGSFVTFLQSGNTPWILAFTYVVLALPFTYRSLDAGIRSIDATTLDEAARNLGAGWLSVTLRVLVPALRTAILNAAFLAFALAFGEYTIATFLQYTTFSVAITKAGTTEGQLQTALSIMSLALAWVLLLVLSLLLTSRSSRKATR
jgi:putative spermidine/putrescine transport system permease protein